MITKSLDENNKVVKGFRYTAIASFSAPTIICIYVKELQVGGFLPPKKSKPWKKQKVHRYFDLLSVPDVEAIFQTSFSRHMHLLLLQTNSF